MKLLFIGDIFGRPGRQAVAKLLPKLREEESIDLVFANADNAHHGNGMSIEIYEELRALGVDWLTGGDHIWGVKDFLPYLDDPAIRVLRPANYPSGAPGRGVATLTVEGEDVTLVHLQGQVFMKSSIDNPFHIFDALQADMRGHIIVDFHAEATSEKNCFGHYVDGRATAVLGTHTHVQTADERLLPKGTAYITDVGMTGPMDGSIGANINEILPSFLTGLPFRLEPASGPVEFNAVMLEIASGSQKTIRRIHRVLES